MASAFSLTLAYLGERCSARDTSGAFAAYITGNVASNLFGRLLAAAAADRFGLASNFFVFAGLSIAGAILVYMTIDRVPAMEAVEAQERRPLHVLLSIWATAAFAQPSRSVSAFSSPSSGFSLTSISSLSVRRLRSA
jgi:MFS transporter, YNFM family, putative membrane transport protein